MTVMLYRHPGPHKIHGADFDYIIVEDDAVNATVKDGWFMTTDEALAGPKKRKPRTKKE